MKISWITAFAMSLSLIGPAAEPVEQGGATATVKLVKAGLSSEVSSDQREPLAPAAGQKFLWVSATLSGAPQTIDLFKVSLVSGADTFPLIGVDSAFDGDPSSSR